MVQPWAKLRKSHCVLSVGECETCFRRDQRYRLCMERMRGAFRACFVFLPCVAQTHRGGDQQEILRDQSAMESRELHVSTTVTPSVPTREIVGDGDMDIANSVADRFSDTTSTLNLKYYMYNNIIC